MSFDPTEYAPNIARGRVPGSEHFTAYGEKTTSGADSGVIWPNGAFVFPPASGLQMSISSDSANDTAAGTGIRTLDVHYLDDALVPQIETVTMNGTTPVLTVATNIRFIQCMHMVTWGSLTGAGGHISASNGGNTYSYIDAGDTRCTSSVRMVPAGKRLIIHDLFAGAVSGTAGAKVIVRASTPTFDGHDFTTANVFIPIASAAYQDGSSGMRMTCPVALTEGMSFGLTFECDKACTVVGSWFGWLENV